MKTNQKWIVLALCTSFTAFAVAQEEPELVVQGGIIEEDVAAFPTDVAATQLTPEQEELAGKVLDEARAIYADILNDDAEGKAEYLQSNLVFVDERIEKTAQKLKTKKGELDVLNGKVLAAYDKIKALKVDGKVKAQKRIQLVDEFRNEKETLTFRINMLENHLKALQSRQSMMKGELANLGEVAEKKPTDLEKADQALGEIKRTEQLKRFEKYDK